MNAQTAIVLAGVAKQTVFQLMELIAEIESEEGITVMKPDELEKLYNDAMERREFQKTKE